MKTKALSREQYPVLTEAMSTMAWSYSFWSTLLYDQLKIEITEDLPTLGVGGGKLLINMGYFEGKLTPMQRLAALAHEIGHEMFFHPTKMKEYAAGGFDGEPFDAMRFNFAGDYVINDMLKQLRVGQLHGDWLWSEHFDYKMGVEEVYRRLKPKDPPPSGGGSSEGEGDDSGGSGGSSASNTPPPPPTQQYDILDENGNAVAQTPKMGKPQDTHNFFEESPSSELDWKTAVAGAYEGAKAIGHGSADMDRIIGDFIDTKRNWKEIFRDYIVKQRGRDRRNYRNIHKRRLKQYRLVTPTKYSHKIGDVGVIYDVSGSVGPDEHRLCSSAIAEILLDCTPKAMRCICVASDVIGGSDTTFTSVSDFEQWQPSGCGGTDMEAGFRYFEEENYKPHVVIVLTDGWTGFSDPPPWPVIWVSTDREPEHYPYGDVVMIGND